MPSTLIELLRSRADELGPKTAFRYYRSEASETVLSYRELEDRARAIGGHLQSVARLGDRALLLFPPGLDFITAFFGCLYAGVVAVPLAMPRRNRANGSMEFTCADARPALVLSTAAHRAEREDLYSQVPTLLSLPWIDTDAVPEATAAEWSDPGATESSLAFLQYTSGSTTAPRGVMVTHRNLLHNSTLIHKAFVNGPRSEAVIWLPHYHDMGLIGGVIQPVYCRGSATLLAPAAFLQRPITWLELISRHRATVSGGPDFAYALCAQKFAPSHDRGLDLSCWEVAFTGAEPIRSQTLDRFTETFAPCGFRREAFFPCYGLAEATLIVSGGPRQQPPAIAWIDKAALAEHRVVDANGSPDRGRIVVGCGRPLDGQQVRIVDPKTHRPCLEGRVGEIWVSGPSVTQGYFGRADLSRDVFCACLADSGEGPFLRTGDIGFFRDGQLVVTGRLKDLIIIRGRNYYPQDIEQVVEESHEAFRKGFCAAFSVDMSGREVLVVVQEIDPRRRELDIESALRAVRQSVADNFELEVYAIILAKPGTIPKTSSGKTRRSACHDRFLEGQHDVIAQWTAVLDFGEDVGDTGTQRALPPAVAARDIEQWLVERIATRLRVPRSEIRTNTPFLEFGIGSVDAVQIVADLEQWLGRSILPTAVYNYPSISALARHLANDSPRPAVATAVPEKTLAVTEGTPEEILREVKGLSQEEIERFITQEIGKQAGN